MITDDQEARRAAAQPASPFLGDAGGGGQATSQWLDLESPFLSAAASERTADTTFAGQGWEAEELEGQSGYEEFATHASDEALERLEASIPDETETFMAGAVRHTHERAIVLAAIKSGQRTEKGLTNRVFFLRYPGRTGTRIATGEDAIAREWIQIRDQLVIPLLLEGPRIGPIHDKSASLTPEMRRGVPSEAVLSPLAITTRGLRRAPHRQPGAVTGVVVHTTSRGPANRSSKHRYRPAAIDYALDHYIDGSEGFPHYVIDFNGTIYAICDERRVAHHAGWVHPGGGKLFSQGWTAPSWWSAVWTAQGVRTPLNLLATGARSPNQRTIGIELLMLPGPRSMVSYTHEQYSSLARLIVDLQSRNPELQITTAPSRSLLGHEDFTPVTGKGGRADDQGGWDPGAHRDRPWFSWTTLWNQIQQIVTGSESREAAALYPSLTSEANADHPALEPLFTGFESPFGGYELDELSADTRNAGEPVESEYEMPPPAESDYESAASDAREDQRGASGWQVDYPLDEQADLRTIASRTEDGTSDFSAQVFGPPVPELTVEWSQSGSFEEGILSTTLDKEEREARMKSPEVQAFRFKGRSDEVALVFAGVHRSEPEGVYLAELLVDLLKSTTHRPRFTTIVIPKLFELPTPRSAKPPFVAEDSRRYVKDRKGSLIEPNRNFPRPGDSYADTRRMGRDVGQGKELVIFVGESTKLLTDRMLPETRILVQLIESVKPTRAASLHGKTIKGNARGNGPGMFVDPRGGFNEGTDKALSLEGRSDDALATRMVDEFVRRLRLRPKHPKLRHPLAGNLLSHSGELVVNANLGTMHYTATHPAGTSFGMWAPTGERCGLRSGITTFTIEFPRYGESPDAEDATKEVADIHKEILATVFLELPP